MEIPRRSRLRRGYSAEPTRLRYSTFVAENRERLSELPAPSVATSYYSSGDLYLFDARPLRGASRAVVARERSSLESGRPSRAVVVEKSARPRNRQRTPIGNPAPHRRTSRSRRRPRAAGPSARRSSTSLPTSRSTRASTRGAARTRVASRLWAALDAASREDAADPLGRRGSAWTPRINLEPWTPRISLDAAGRRRMSPSTPRSQVKTMRACQDYASMGSRVVSPHLRDGHAEASRERWIRWAEDVNAAGK